MSVEDNRGLGITHHEYLHSEAAPSRNLGATNMAPDIFTTQAVRKRDQYEAWRNRFKPVLEVIAKHQAGDGFPAEKQVWTLGGMAMSRVSAPPGSRLATKDRSPARFDRPLGSHLLPLRHNRDHDGQGRVEGAARRAIPLVPGRSLRM